MSAEVIELSYSALSSLEDVIAILRNVSSLTTLFYYLASYSYFSIFLVFYSCRKNETKDLGFHVYSYICAGYFYWSIRSFQQDCFLSLHSVDKRGGKRLWFSVCVCIVSKLYLITVLALVYRWLLHCMVAQLLYVIRSSNQLKGLFKLLLNLLQREGGNWLKLISQGLKHSVYTNAALLELSLLLISYCLLSL